MKRKFSSIIIFIIVVALLYFFYSYFFKKIEYSFDNSFVVNGKVIAKGEQFKKEITNISLDNNVISSNYLGVRLKLSKYELNKVLHSKKTNKYIHSYQKVEDLGVGIVTESPI